MCVCMCESVCVCMHSIDQHVQSRIMLSLRVNIIEKNAVNTETEWSVPFFCFLFLSNLQWYLW